jgi:hypothetical protein
MKKIRGDAAEHKLPPQARDELAALVTANAPLKTIQALFDRHGVDLSLTGAARAHHRVKAAADRLLQRAATLHALRQLATKQGVTLTGAALEQATVAVGDLLDASIDPGSDEGQQLLLKPFACSFPDSVTDTMPNTTGAVPSSRLRRWRPQTRSFFIPQIENLCLWVLDGIVAPRSQAVFTTIDRPAETQPRLGHYCAKICICKHV